MDESEESKISIYLKSLQRNDDAIYVQKYKWFFT
jgi:hypothetical protein